ncbi:hypothetical protein E2I00_006067, partial [Balaenoptera physalus]
CAECALVSHREAEFYDKQLKLLLSEKDMHTYTSLPGSQPVSEGQLPALRRSPCPRAGPRLLQTLLCAGVHAEALCETHIPFFWLI